MPNVQILYQLELTFLKHICWFKRSILEKIKNSEIFCSQIFLMGDNFDFLSYEIKYFKYKKDIAGHGIYFILNIILHN